MFYYFTCNFKAFKGIKYFFPVCLLSDDASLLVCFSEAIKGRKPLPSVNLLKIHKNKISLLKIGYYREKGYSLCMLMKNPQNHGFGTLPAPYVARRTLQNIKIT